MTTSWRSDWTQFTGRPFYIGGVYFPDSTGNTNDRRLTGKIHAVRVYKRSLSDAELEQNRIVDEARFFGNPPAVANLTVVNVQPEGATETVQSSVEDGVYNLAGYVTVKSGTLRIGGIKYAPSFVLETYEDGVWTYTASGKGSSYTVTGGSVPQRLTCKWMPVGFLMLVR